MHTERLLQVVRVLEELPKDKKFALDEWMRCGTVGCAIGWAASDPWFRRRGFKLVLDCEINGIPLNKPAFKDSYAREACVEFFDISREHLFHLFYPHRYPKTVTKLDVINRIKQFVKEGNEMEIKDPNGLRQRYTLIGRDDDGKLDALHFDKWNETMRVIADNDYPDVNWFAVFDSDEKIAALRLIEGDHLAGLVQEYEDSRAADERHERSLGRVG